MKKALLCAALVVTALGLVYSSRAARTVAAQEQITGDWSAKVTDTDKGKRLWLQMETRKPNGHSQMSSTFKLEEFSGFNPNANGNTQFAMKREAGEILFTGLVNDGKGVGDFHFTPNGNFINAMRGLGYDNLSPEKVFAMTLHDVTTKFVDEVKRMGFDKVSADKLIAFRIF